MTRSSLCCGEYVNDLQSVFQNIKDAIKYSHHKQKLATDKYRRAITFKVDDWVLLKFPKARLQHTSGKNWQGKQTCHQKYYTKLCKTLLWTILKSRAY